VYLKKIRLQNIKCFEDVTLEFPHRGGDYAGWNVILGENGRGKSTILRSIALGVLSPSEFFFAIEQQEGEFARQGAKGRSVATIDHLYHAAELQQASETIANDQQQLIFNLNLTGPSEVGTYGPGRRLKIIPHLLCYGYGPFRRLEGGSRSVPSALQFPKPLSRFVTLFTDDVGLVDATRGLIDLYVASVDPKHTLHRAAERSLGRMIEVVDALVPGGVQLDGVTSEQVRFRAAPGVQLTEKELSDGYRGFLSLILDLLRHLLARFGPAFPGLIQWEGDGVVVDVEAVVLIDEADAHLHPSWQRELGERLRRVFPKVQFIVTTHSPFVAQAATDGGLFVLRSGEDGAVVVDQPVESVRGWTASQILTSPLFGLDSTRDPETESLIREHAALTAKKRAGDLTPADKKRLAVVQKQLSATLSAPGETFEEMQRQQEMDAYIDDALHRLKNDKK
jgi:predicted ATP-binding protein involved in virulence